MSHLYKRRNNNNNFNFRMNLEEEVDCLRVQTTSDASTIVELNRCLQQERQGRVL